MVSLWRSDCHAGNWLVRLSPNRLLGIRVVFILKADRKGEEDIQSNLAFVHHKDLCPGGYMSMAENPSSWESKGSSLKREGEDAFAYVSAVSTPSVSDLCLSTKAT